jgi:acetyl esterase
VARTLALTVVSVDYRRAPEHAYPAALEDSRRVAESLRGEFDVWCALAGDSAGGNLAAAVTLSPTGDRGFDALLLLYPCLDASMSEKSYETYAEGYGLTREAMEYYWRAYGGTQVPTDPLLSPQAVDSVSAFPPTVLALAGFDVLFDEGQKLARRLLAADVRLTYLPYLSLPHGFIELVDRVSAAREAVAQILAGLTALVPGHLVRPPQ